SGPLFRPNANSRGNSSTRGDPKDFGLPRPPFEGPADRTCCAGRRRQARILLSAWHIQACRTGKLCANSTPVGINDVKWLLPPPAGACLERQVADFIEFKDADGHPLALSYGFEIDKDPVRYTRELNVVGLGHVLLTVKDTQRSHDFYTGVLGFRLSDWICIDDHIRLCFLRCNARHHSTAFAPCMPGKSPRLQHVMLEVESLDDVMRSYHF